MTQEIPPIPMIEKDNMGTFNDASGYIELYVDNMMGTNVQKAYNSHICPKYPNAADLKFLFLNTLKKTERSNFWLGFRKGPLGTNVIINAPPIIAKQEVLININFQGDDSTKPFNKCGKAVPNTNAPTKKPSDFPRPFSK